MNRVLKIYFDDQLLTEVHMDSSQEYIIGRSEDCDIAIDDKTISRQHLKFYHDSANWHVQCLSRWQNLTDAAGLTVDSIAVGPTETSFFVGNYRFVVENYQYEEHQLNNDSIDLVPEDELTSTDNINFRDDDTGDSIEDLDRTAHGVSDGSSSHLQAYIRIVAPGDPDIIKRLDGNVWTVGRTDECDIQLPFPVISRRHFQIRKSGHHHYVEELGSSNGTFLNGEPLKPNQPVPIDSGDRLQIKEIKVFFEVRDPRFEKKMQSLATIVDSQSNLPVAPPPGAVRIPPPTAGMKSGGANRKRLITIGAALVIIVAVLVELTGDKDGSKDIASTEKGKAKTIDTGPKLTYEQENTVKIRYESATRLMRESKYELALIELQKLHEITPSYEDSRRMETSAQDAIDKLKQLEEIERMERQKEEALSKANDIVELCRQKHSNPIGIAEVELCLEPVVELDPENQNAKLLLEEARQKISAREQQKRNIAQYNRNVRLGEGQYNKARAAHKSGSLVEAKKAYQRHVASSYPDPKGLKPKSKSALQSIDKEIDAKVKQLKAEVETAQSAKDHKGAILRLREIKKYLPNDSNIDSEITTELRALNSKSKELFQDARLEEGLGNLEAAKVKWNKIVETDLPEGEYYQRAKIKLKKYGQ